MKHNTKFALLLSALALTGIAASYDDLSKGIDLTAQTSVTASQLNQLVDNATVYTNKGMIVYTNAPPIVTGNNARYKRFIWLDHSVDPPALKVWGVASAAWQSNTIGTATIQSNNIAAFAVNDTKIFADSITTPKIVNNAVIESKIGSLAVTTDKIQALAVTSNQIASSTITTRTLDYSAVTSTNIDTGAIDNRTLGVASITGSKIAAATITSNNIGYAAIAITNMGYAAVNYTNLVSGSAFTVMQNNNSGVMSSRNLILQVQSSSSGALITCPTVITMNDVIPAITAGDPVINVAFTPRSASSTIIVSAVVNGFVEAAGIFGVALIHNGSATVAVGYNGGYINTGSVAPSNIKVDYIVASGSTTLRTYYLRAGASIDAGSFHVNGSAAGSRLFGGVSATTLTVTEIEN